ncbi:MAG: TatD family hydrolase [Flavobacteriales bacterium]|jgi:TatD DNase family protein|nr:TatD family hydrolase [Flavobacteriales bacterium]MBK6550063.1 TatD family hydrolase [Flavobacteriales bacterium]MBK6881773.1 TatD family hydrolase [Flavobacteriales bacterium]MBK7102574.1 TatD family hydrolase [Flavobacteriales bacterium]MBK7113307.1 TatD family hydrolase [Flavobacteriales bacterium]
MFIDTHAHLYHRQFDPDREELLRRAEEAGVTKFFLPNVDHESIEGMNALAAAHPESCFAMMGLHPCSVTEMNDLALEEVEQHLRSGGYCAVGEIGIDLHWDKTWLVQQQAAFRQQVRWAKELDLPIVIHCRQSFEETIAIVEQEQDGSLRGVFHCFTGSPEEAARIVALKDFYMGIGGVITYPKGGLFETMQVVGPERCVLETDAPYLAPVPFRGRRNESAYIPHIAAKLAEATGRSVEEIARITTTNAQELFRR